MGRYERSTILVSAAGPRKEIATVIGDCYCFALVRTINARRGSGAMWSCCIFMRSPGMGHSATPKSIHRLTTYTGRVTDSTANCQMSTINSTGMLIQASTEKPAICTTLPPKPLSQTCVLYVRVHEYGRHADAEQSGSVRRARCHDAALMNLPSGSRSPVFWIPGYSQRKLLLPLQFCWFKQKHMYSV
jgi:hypothetical protein